MQSRILSTAILTALLSGGCAGQPERPVAEMSRAKALIEQAEQQHAQQYAGAELERARQKLSQADAAVERGDTEEAARLSLQAAVDAELAAAKARSAEAKKSADELDQSVESLRQEASRSQTPPPE